MTRYYLKRKLEYAPHSTGNNWRYLCHRESRLSTKGTIDGLTFISDPTLRKVEFGSIFDVLEMVGKFKAIEGRKHIYAHEAV